MPLLYTPPPAVVEPLWLLFVARQEPFEPPGVANLPSYPSEANPVVPEELFVEL